MSEKIKTIILVVGNQYEVDTTIEKLKKQVSHDSLVVMDGSKDEIRSICSEIMASDMFGRRKIILINGVPNKDSNSIIPYLEKAPSENVVAFYSYSSIKGKKKFYEFFKSKARLIEFDCEVKNPHKIIRKLFEENKKSCQDDVLAEMVGYIGNDIGVIVSEVEKLVNYMGARKAVNKEDIHQICCSESEFFIWDFIKYLSAGDIKKSMESLSCAVSSGSGHDFVLSIVARSLRLSLILKDLGDMPINDIIEKAKEIKKVNGSSMYNDYEIRSLFNNQKSFYKRLSFLELCKCLKDVYTAMVDVRKQYRESDKEKVMSMLLFSICYPRSFKINYSFGDSYGKKSQD